MYFNSNDPILWHAKGAVNQKKSEALDMYESEKRKEKKSEIEIEKYERYRNENEWVNSHRHTYTPSSEIKVWSAYS